MRELMLSSGMPVKSLPEMRARVETIKGFIANEMAGQNRSNRIKMLQFDLSKAVRMLLRRQKKYLGGKGGPGRTKKEKT